jgi:glycosyltransferase involved in cell wall biosynthesis
VRICIVYDCLYPHTVGGAERWYRNLAQELAGAGHDVTYLTRLQWEPGESPDVPGVRVVVVSRSEPLYTEYGRRRIGPPLRFGFGVLKHLLRNRRAYDAVHLCSFPYFSLLGARLALAGSRVTIGVDWFEVWSWSYWRDYLGPVGGRIGQLVQRLCARVTPTAYVFSELHARRLEEEGLRRPAVRLAGLYAGSNGAQPDAAAGPDGPLVVFAGRHIPEKQVELVPAAVAAARERVPGLRGLILGDGPCRDDVLAAIAAARAEGFVDAPGFVASGEVQAALARATCHLLPSSREGYGLVVIEAAAFGTPSIVLRGLDNAAAELVEGGVNGFVADGPEALADAIVAVHEGGEALRDSTARWFADNASTLSATASATTILRRLERAGEDPHPSHHRE